MESNIYFFSTVILVIATYAIYKQTVRFSYELELSRIKNRLFDLRYNDKLPIESEQYKYFEKSINEDMKATRKINLIHMIVFSYLANKFYSDGLKSANQKQNDFEESLKQLENKEYFDLNENIKSIHFKYVFYLQPIICTSIFLVKIFSLILSRKIKKSIMQTRVKEELISRYQPKKIFINEKFIFNLPLNQF